MYRRYVLDIRIVPHILEKQNILWLHVANIVKKLLKNNILVILRVLLDKFFIVILYCNAYQNVT